MPRAPIELTPLDQETRTVLPTCEAAAHLNRAPQTLLLWACKGKDPLRPTHINGRLGWNLSEIKHLVGSK